MKKALIIILALCMVLSLTACGAKATPAEVYTAESDWVEAGYEGDCIITNRLVLVLNGDGSYSLEDGFFVNQVSGAIVYYVKTMYTGTYTAGAADAEGNKTITLAAPTGGYQNMNGVVSTVADDAEPDLASITVNTGMGIITSEVPHHS